MKGKYLFPLLILIITAGNAWAGGGLMLTPKRVMFEGKTRAASLTLLNSGDTNMTYRVSFKEMGMDQSGILFDIPDEEAKFTTSKMIRYSPRQVTLKPGEQQVVRMVLRKPRGISEGEYRSHLVVAEVPDVGGLDVDSLSGGGKKRVGAVLNTSFAISAPIIVRHGRLDAQARVRVASLVPAGDVASPKINLEISRDGERSVYGDVEIHHLVHAAAEPKVLATVRGVSVYTTTLMRTLTLELSGVTQEQLASGLLRVVYKSREKASDGDILAQAEHPLATH